MMALDETDPEGKTQLSGFMKGLADLGWTDGSRRFAASRLSGRGRNRILMQFHRSAHSSPQPPPRLDLQPLGDPRNVVDRYVTFRALHRTEVRPVDPALMGQGFLTEVPRGAQPAHVLRQHVPQLALVRRCPRRQGGKRAQYGRTVFGDVLVEQDACLGVAQQTRQL